MNTKIVTITLKEETIKKMKELAKKEDRSFSNMVQRILEERFRKDKKENITLEVEELEK